MLRYRCKGSTDTDDGRLIDGVTTRRNHGRAEEFTTWTDSSYESDGGSSGKLREGSVKLRKCRKITEGPKNYGRVL
jgi:hypothetical protein